MYPTHMLWFRCIIVNIRIKVINNSIHLNSGGRYLLTCSLNSTSAYYKASAKTTTITIIIIIINVTISKSFRKYLNNTSGKHRKQPHWVIRTSFEKY